jgi:hypothetical protein
MYGYMPPEVYHHSYFFHLIVVVNTLHTGSVVLDVPTCKRSAEAIRLHDRVRYSSMSPDQIDARRKKMREYNAARLSGVTTDDEILNDAHEQTPLNMTIAEPNNVGSPFNHESVLHSTHAPICTVATNDIIMRDAQDEHMTTNIRGATAHDQDNDAYGIFEPTDDPSWFEGK